jgi:diacylglycerol kinase family enzyme
MRRIALIYNPVSGTRRRQRTADVEAAARVFRARGAEVRKIATESSGSAGRQAVEAARDGADAIICCGGDGTIHDAVQPLVAGRAAVPVGVIPLGTGNGLAAELRIPRNPSQAARALLHFEPRRVPLGKIEYAGRDGVAHERYFLISAGVGADAEMLYRLSVETKDRFGLWAYYAHAFHLFLTHRFLPMEVEYRMAGEPEARCEVVAQVLAGRIERFGGLMSRLTPGGSLESDTMQLVLFRTPRRWPILRHATAAALRNVYRSRQVEVVSASEVICRPLAADAALPAAWRRAKLASRAYAQADGELLGGLPVRMSMVPDALALLMPPRVQRP